MYIILSQFEAHQSDLMRRIALDKQLDKTPLLQQILQAFITSELIQYKKLELVYGSLFKGSQVFDPATPKGRERYRVLHDRVVEHVFLYLTKRISE